MKFTLTEDKESTTVYKGYGLDVASIVPEGKDMMRARNLEFHGSTRAYHLDHSPWYEDARNMAKKITDPKKLIRRTKAMVSVWKNDLEIQSIWASRLKEFGFSTRQIAFVINDANYD